MILLPCWRSSDVLKINPRSHPPEHQRWNTPWKKVLRVGEQSCGGESDFLSQKLVEMLQNETHWAANLVCEEAVIYPPGAVSCCSLQPLIGSESLYCDGWMDGLMMDGLRVSWKLLYLHSLDVRTPFSLLAWPIGSISQISLFHKKISDDWLSNPYIYSLCLLLCVSPSHTWSCPLSWDVVSMCASPCVRTLALVLLQQR